MSFTTPTARWAALTTRNRHADGTFIYGVHTTKIYCRPSCPARLARRANVSFFDTAASASQAGYRACKRCKPDSVQPQPDPQDQAVRKACAVIRDALTSSTHVNGHIGLNELAEKVGLTPSYLHKTFKARMGCTPKAYAARLRGEEGEEEGAEAAAAALESKHLPSADLFPLSFDSNTMFSTTVDMNNAASNYDLDFDFGAASSTVDALSDPADLTSCGLSEATTSIHTPMTSSTTTTISGFPWLDDTTGPTFEGCEFFDAETLARQMMELDAAAAWGWDDGEYSLAHSEPWDDNLRIAEGVREISFQPFDLGERVW